MDTILIEQLELNTIIGVHAWEQHAPRRIVVDLELGCDTRSAAASDQLRDAVNYRAVCDTVETLVREQRFQLIETLAEAIARRLIERFPILSVRLLLSKPGAVPAARNVAVRIERRREDYAACGTRPIA
jgi:dihydroneopterin aldolase